jgi:RNA polymerase sigma-70 factor (ECF subfamily)
MLTINGSKEAFSKIYNQYYDKIYKFIYYRTFNREISEDLTGQTFLKVLEYFKSYDPLKGKFNSWIYKIAINCVNKHFKRYKSTDDYADIWDIKSDIDLEIDVEQKILFEKIKPVLKNLPAEKRLIIIMRIWDDLSYKEIAKILDKNETNCRMIFSRTMKELRELMPRLTIILIILILNK